MNLRRDMPSTVSDFDRLRARYDVPLALLGFIAAGLRLHRAVRRDA